MLISFDSPRFWVLFVWTKPPTPLKCCRCVEESVQMMTLNSPQKIQVRNFQWKRPKVNALLIYPPRKTKTNIASGRSPIFGKIPSKMVSMEMLVSGSVIGQCLRRATAQAVNVPELLGRHILRAMCKRRCTKRFLNFSFEFNEVLVKNWSKMWKTKVEKDRLQKTGLFLDCTFDSVHWEDVRAARNPFIPMSWHRVATLEILKVFGY